MPGVRGEDVRRLDASVDQAVGVRRVERVSDRLENRERVRRRQVTASQPLRKVGALDVSHRDEEHTFGLAGLVERDRVWVIERRSKRQFKLEPLAEARVGR